MNESPRMLHHMPEDPAFLQALARVTIAHAALDHALKMYIRSLADLTIDEALGATDREGSRILRERIRKLAKIRLGEGSSLLKLQARMRQCENVTERRNRITHSLIAELEGSGARMQTAPGAWEVLPEAKELDNLAAEILMLVMDLNHERIIGYLAIELEKKKLSEVRGG